MVLKVALVLLLFLSSSICLQASEGDQSEVFQQCLSSCFATGCTRTPGSRNTCDTVCPNRGNSDYKPPLSLQIMMWDCESDCSYHCMWAIEGPKAAAGEGPVYKYYGKWPFIRILGAQEIASVVFSIANLLAHAHNLHMYLQFIRGHKSGSTAGLTRHSTSGAANVAQYPYHYLWVVYSLVNLNAWLWSSFFHCRDTRLTERLDYFSADLVVAVGCGVVIVRVLQLTSVRSLVVLSLILGTALMQHIYYMSFIKFDYGYNMMLCIVIGISTAVTWLVWATRTQHPGRWLMYKFMALVHLAMLLEVLDFPPLLQLFDAHALWHAATVPLTYLWYRFIKADVQARQQQHTAAGDGGKTSLAAINGLQPLISDKQKQ